LRLNKSGRIKEPIAFSVGDVKMREERTDGLEALQVLNVFLGQCEAAELFRYELLPGWQDIGL